MINVAAKYTFGAGGNAIAIRQDGWSVDEPNYTWTIGTQSRLHIPLKDTGLPLSLEISVTPMIAPPSLRRQRLMIDVNGTRLADEDVGGEATIGIVLPPDAVRSGALDITLHHPQAQIPAELGLSPDPRRLGFAVADLILLGRTDTAFKPRTLPPLPVAAAGGLAQAVRFLTALPLQGLATQFENLGHNWELSLVQRAMGAEPAGLLSFAAITPKRLLNGLDAGFENIAARHNLTAFTQDDRDDGEWMVRDATYQTEFHTSQIAPNIAEAELLAQFATELATHHRKFLETLQSGAKIFVFQHPRAATLAQMRPFLTLLRAHGPNSLLFISEDAASAAGTVTQLEPDLFHGHIPRFAPSYNVPGFQFDPWVSILANTYRMWRESGGGAR